MPLDDEVPVFTISHAFFACAPQTETTDLEFFEEPKGLLALLNT